jgi:hypothetical protein
MNIKIGRYQFFNSTWWVGFTRYTGSMGMVLEWTIGLGIIHIHKYLK